MRRRKNSPSPGIQKKVKRKGLPTDFLLRWVTEREGSEEEERDVELRCRWLKLSRLQQNELGDHQKI